MEGRSLIWDPLRKKEVALTPEEQVRQWFIGVLKNELAVPPHMMMSEVSFKLGEKAFRADIVVYGRNSVPLAVVECKRPEVTLDQSTLEQTLRYNLVLKVPYIFVTNGASTFIAARGEDGRYGFVGKAPDYDTMKKAL